jgi:hypothetical protein
MRTRQKWVGIIVVLAALLLASAGPGLAWGGHGGGGHGFHHGFHGGFHRFGGPRIGIGLGPFWAPYWGAYPFDPYPPVGGQPSWYYCDNLPGYYPYVPQCSSGWRAVAPTP